MPTVPQSCKNWQHIAWWRRDAGNYSRLLKWLARSRVLSCTSAARFRAQPWAPVLASPKLWGALTSTRPREYTLSIGPSFWPFHLSQIFQVQGISYCQAFYVGQGLQHSQTSIASRSSRLLGGPSQRSYTMQYSLYLSKVYKLQRTRPEQELQDFYAS